jgi:hypothetical protein
MDPLQAKADAFRKAEQKASAEYKEQSLRRFSLTVLRQLAPAFDISAAELAQLGRDYDTDPLAEVRERYDGPLGHLYACTHSVKPECLLYPDMKRSRLWKEYMGRLAEDPSTVLAFRVKRTAWILTTMISKRRLVAQGRVVYPAAGQAPDAYAIGLNQYIEENA